MGVSLLNQTREHGVGHVKSKCSVQVKITQELCQPYGISYEQQILGECEWQQAQRDSAYAGKTFFPSQQGQGEFPSS